MSTDVAAVPKVTVQTAYLTCPECGYQQYVFLDRFNPDEDAQCRRCGVRWYGPAVSRILEVLEDPNRAEITR